MPRRIIPNSSQQEDKEFLEPKNISIDINDLLVNPEIPKLYANSFGFGFSMSDATLVLQVGRSTTGIINMSFTTLKTLAGDIQDLVKTIEESIGEELKDTGAIRRKMISKTDNK